MWLVLITLVHSCLGQTVWDIVSTTGELSEFTATVPVATQSLLSAEGSYTVLAPINDALPSAQTSPDLHVITGSVHCYSILTK
jgi:hypothetical protein